MQLSGALVFSNDKNPIYPSHIQYIIEDINEKINYCRFFEWNTLNELELTRIKINDEWKMILILKFDTEA